jgi:tetratricopeptide (TPR) repeat protein
MNESTEHIDNYFNRLLSPEEKQDFETRVENDEAFAEEVALYIAGRSALRDELLQQKRKEWEGKTDPAKRISTRVIKMKRWYAVAAAAAVISIVLLLVPFGKTPQQLAGKYIEDYLRQISVTMSGTNDSLQTGIAAYNKKEYRKAHEIFSKLYHQHPGNTDALKYDGLSSLMLEEYSGAINLFDSLAAKQSLYANPGLFYKALVLIKRNEPRDKEEAKLLLKQVIDGQLDDRKEAARLLQKM